MILTKEMILKGIRTCSHLENIWYNGNLPDSSFEANVVDIRHMIEELLFVNLPDSKED